MRSPRKNSTYRSSGLVTTSRAKPEDIARLQASARSKRKLYSDTPGGLRAISKVGTSTKNGSMPPDELEDLVRAQERKHAATRHRSNADRLWGPASR